MEVLLYSEQVDPKNGHSMHSSLVLTLMPILKLIYQEDYSFEPKLFITANEIAYLEKNYPEENMLIKSLVKEDKLEMLSGSFSNINPLLFPSRNISEDIEKMATLIRKTYSKRPESYFAYKNVFAPNLISALSDLEIEDIYTSYLYDANIDKEEFYYSEGTKAVTVHTPLRNSKDFFVVNLDLIIDDPIIFVGNVMRLFTKIDCRENPTIQSFEDLPSAVPYYYQNSDFLQSGCYDGTNEVNFLSKLFKGQNEFFDYLMYVRNILLNQDNRKNYLKGKKHLDAKMYALSDLSLYLSSDLSDDYRNEKRRIFASLLEELSSLSLLSPNFETPNNFYEVLYSKNIFALCDKTATITKLLYLPKNIDFVENGYAFKSTFVEESKQKENIGFFIDIEAEATEADMEWCAFTSRVETVKQIHIRNASATVKFMVKNNERKSFIADFENEFCFHDMTVDSKSINGEIKNLRLKLGGAESSVLLSSTKPFSLKDGIKFDEKSKSLLIKPTFNIKLKRGETFDVSFTLKYEKAQGEKNADTKPTDS